MFFWVQPPRMGEHGGGATCVDVVHNAVERFGGAALGRSSDGNSSSSYCTCGGKAADGGGGLGTPGANERSGTCLGEGAA